MGNFCGPVLTHNPFTLKIQKMYLVCLFNGRVTKNKRCPKSKTLRQFRPIALKLMKPVVNILQSMFY